MKPTICRMVVYVLSTGEECPAVVIGPRPMHPWDSEDQGRADLFVFTRHGGYAVVDVRNVEPRDGNECRELGTWHWPQRV